MLLLQRGTECAKTRRRAILPVDPDMATLQAMKTFVQALYTGDLHLCDSAPELAMEVYIIAHFYDCVHVMQLCESALSIMIDAETVLDIHEWTTQFEGTEWTQRQVNRWIRRNFTQLAANKETLCQLTDEQFLAAISSDFLQAEEQCVLRAIYDYCAGVSAPEDGEEGDAEPTHAPRDVTSFLEHVRFPFVGDEGLQALSDAERAEIPVEYLAERAAFLSTNTIFSHDALGMPMKLSVDPQWAEHVATLDGRFESLSKDHVQSFFKKLSVYQV